MRAHIGERGGGALQRARHGRDEALGCLAHHVAQAPLRRVGFLEPLVGGTALPARRVPRGLLGCPDVFDRQRVCAMDAEPFLRRGAFAPLPALRNL